MHEITFDYDTLEKEKKAGSYKNGFLNLLVPVEINDMILNLINHYLTPSTNTDAVRFFGAWSSVLCFSKVIKQLSTIRIAEQQTLMITCWYS